MKKLREVFSIPVPRILSWSCEAANNPVQAEYIIEEKVPGVRLGSMWPSLPWREKLAIVEQVVDFDCSLTSIQFEKLGCIYFKEDLQRFIGRSNVVQFTSDRTNPALDQYVMGPLTKAELWVNGREHMNLDRGPCKSMIENWCQRLIMTNFKNVGQDFLTYAKDLCANEVQWIQQFAKSRMNYFQSLKEQETPKHALDLLARYELLTPALALHVNANNHAFTNILWHPDLHLDNIFIDPVSCKITGIIDWQSAMVAPLFYQSGVHRAFRHYKSVRDGWYVPEKPDDFDTLPLDEKKRIDQDHESETIHKYYELQTLKRAPRHWEYLQQSKVPVLRKPIWLVTGVWENGDLFFLRDSLITLHNRWNEIFGENSQCPITFSAEEMEQHAREEENVNGVGKMLSMFRDQGLLPADGMVQPEDYQIAVENCRKYKQILLNAAQNQDERELYSKVWPYNDISDEI